MSEVRKHESFNQRINEKHERKVEKEEQKRLERMQRFSVGKKRKAAHSPKALFDYDFAELELMVAHRFANNLQGVELGT